MTQRRSYLLKLAAVAVAAAVPVVWYVKSHPLVFNESLGGMLTAWRRPASLCEHMLRTTKGDFRAAQMATGTRYC
jgi:hypothetical protein